MGKPKHGNDQRGEQKGAQQHDEGQYGPKALGAKLNEVADHSRSRRVGERELTDPNREGAGRTEADLHESMIRAPELNADGAHRLFENRKQHDEAERGSERNRRDIDVERHGHDRTRVQGHDREDSDVTIRQSGMGGGDH
jgi:hypothetical protein